MEAHPILEYHQKQKVTRHMSFSSGAVEVHSTLEYQKIKGDKIYVEAPAQPSVVELWRSTLP